MIGDAAPTSKPLKNTYSIYKDMYDNNIIYSYKGIVNADLVHHILEIMAESIDEEEQPKKLSKKVSNVMVECLANVYVDEERMEKPTYDPTAMILVKRIEKQYSVVTCNNIPSQRVRSLKEVLDRINRMTPEEMKAFYKTTLANHNPQEELGISDLSIIDLARKSKQRLVYYFKYVNQDYSFFSLEAQISPKSI